jgi:two-component system chemotaxis response regulator CheB
VIAPDVITLDLELPGLSGIELLQKIRHSRPTPAVVVSAYSARGAKLTVEALEAGAVDVVEKPRDGFPAEAMLTELRTKLAIAATARLSRFKRPDAVSRAIPGSAASQQAPSGIELIAIGASTGGPAAVQAVVTELPANAPPVVIVIHMPAGFTRTYAQRLNELSRIVVAEAEDGDALVPGRALVAPGGRQMRIKRRGTGLVVELGTSDKVSGHAPSVDALFDSIAKCAVRRCHAAILTGMGADGAAGMLNLRRAGARTWAQDEASCVVFGMPKAAWDMGYGSRRTRPPRGVPVRSACSPRRTMPPPTTKRTRSPRRRTRRCCRSTRPPTA